MGINKHKWRTLFYFVQSSTHSLRLEMSPASTLLEVPSDSAFRNDGGRTDNTAHVISARFLWLRLTFSCLFNKSASHSAFIPFFVSHYNLSAAQFPRGARSVSCSSGGHTIWSLAPTHFTTQHIPFLQFLLQQTVPLSSRRFRPSDVYLLQC